MNLQFLGVDMGQLPDRAAAAQLVSRQHLTEQNWTAERRHSILNCTALKTELHWTQNYTAYWSALHTEVHYILKCIAYWSASHTEVDCILKCTTYCSALRTALHHTLQLLAFRKLAGGESRKMAARWPEKRQRSLERLESNLATSSRILTGKVFSEKLATFMWNIWQKPDRVHSTSIQHLYHYLTTNVLWYG